MRACGLFSSLGVLGVLAYTCCHVVEKGVGFVLFHKKGNLN